MPFDPAAERAFVEGVLRRDDEFLEQFYRRVAFVRRLAAAWNQRWGRPLNDHELQDVVQETMTTSLMQIASYEPLAPFESWVARICEYTLRNAIRRKARDKTVDLDTGSHVPAPSADLARLVDLEHIEQLLAGLGRLEVLVLKLKYLEGLTFEDIAARLGISTSTTKTLHYRAIERVRSRLEHGGDGEK